VNEHLREVREVADGGDATLFVHLGYQAEKDPTVLNRKPGSEEEKILLAQVKKAVKRDPGRFHRIAKDILGVSEETTTGVHRLYKMHEQGELLPPEVPGCALAVLALHARPEWSGEFMPWNHPEIQSLVRRYASSTSA